MLSIFFKKEMALVMVFRRHDSFCSLGGGELALTH
jgi:hypothetical protein